MLPGCMAHGGWGRGMTPPPAPLGSGRSAEKGKWPAPRQGGEGSLRAQGQGPEGQQEQIPDPLIAGPSLAPSTPRVKRQEVRQRA